MEDEMDKGEILARYNKYKAEREKYWRQVANETADLPPVPRDDLVVYWYRMLIMSENAGIALDDYVAIQNKREREFEKSYEQVGRRLQRVEALRND
jgi:hypothetical protein